MNVSRRQFLSWTATGAAAACVLPTSAALAHAADHEADKARAQKPGDEKPVAPISVASGDELQQFQPARVGSGRVAHRRITSPRHCLFVGGHVTQLNSMNAADCQAVAHAKTLLHRVVVPWW